MSTLLNVPLPLAGTEGAHMDEVVARQGSALESELRRTGWVVRSGWRSVDHAGRAIWQLRFQREARER